MLLLTVVRKDDLSGACLLHGLPKELQFARSLSAMWQMLNVETWAKKRCCSSVCRDAQIRGTDMTAVGDLAGDLATEVRSQRNCATGVYK